MSGYDISLALSSSASAALNNPLSVTDNSVNTTAQKGDANSSSIWPMVMLLGGAALAVFTFLKK